MQRIFHTPEGVRDIYGKECVAKKSLEERLHRVFWLHGFEDIETPSFEYFEVFSNEVGTIPSRELYKLFDRDNNTLVLRPDFTPSVARACAAHFSLKDQVVNLCYTGNTFVNSSSYQGRLREVTQMGVEKMGDASAQADAEILAMVVECLKASGLKEFQVSIGQVDYFKSLLELAGLGEEEEEELRSLISEKNYFGVEELVRSWNIDAQAAQALERMPQLFGRVEILAKARELACGSRAEKAVERLEEIYSYLCSYGYESFVTFDFGMLSKYRYYTGIIFQAYTYGSGEALIKGGRYNDLLRHFGQDAPSIGFAITVDSLLSTLARREENPPQEEEIIRIEYTPDQSREAIEKARRLQSQGCRVCLCLKEGGNEG
ncbi:MAG: ATP phosphoribosyltransferase regulatory subunit [Blautia sp.]|nr:ATP phosphoribosyltransferase regulatory subunit [Blautia sp.]